ncbi:protein toll-like [Mytilus californianus]|uniref:protein toll-like n=1 Tax=Mytilus californianus TaxID=6549 RepID=UPI0022450FE6|nr:protein toll-like [Mytilus californianus]
MGNIINATFLLALSVTASSSFLCQMELEPFNFPSLYNQNSKTVNTVGRFIRIHSANNCDLNTTDIINDYNFPYESMTVGFFVFVCDEYIRISFNQLENATILSSLISYVQLDKCSFDSADIDLFFLITSTRVFSILTANFTSFESAANRSSCEGSKNILALGLTCIHNDIMSFIQYMFNCNNETFNVKEISVSQCIGAINQQLFRKIFPELQTLEVDKCDLEAKVEFPWSINDAFLTGNMSRSEYLQNHIIKSNHLNIPYNMFRRHLSLINNGLTTGSNIQISRRLHFFKISQNNISFFDEDIFKNVEGLQVIILSELGLQEIRGLTFSGLTELLYLDLSKNELSELPPGVFDQLSSLMFLSLAHNSLTVFPKQVFLYLNKLISLDLGYNKILTVGDEILPVNSVALNSLVLKNNPIREFPVTMLYIRGLKTIDIRFTNITFQTMTDFLENVDPTSLIRSVESSSSSIDSDYLQTTENWREIDLRQSHVTGFYITNNASSHAKRMLLIILKHFKFIFIAQSFKCYSDIIPFNKLMQNLNESGYWTGEEYFYTEWSCKLPFEFQGRAVLRLKAEETYSVVNITECPPLCECYIREMFNVIIVNCRDKKLNTLPESMPSGMLDIWLENNNISKLSLQKYLGNVRQLLMSNNKLVEIEPDAFTKMINIKLLKLDNNLLNHIPENIKELDIDMLSLKNNPFICDCHTLWFKKWLTTNINLIENIRDVTCHSENNQYAQQIVELQDNKFVCNGSTLYQLYVIPVVVGILLLFLALILGKYLRVEIKVLLYVTFELHPFDRRKCDKREIIDLAIIHAKDSSEFVEEKLVLPLKRLQFVIFCVAHDFIAGYSLQENVSSIVLRSKHVLLILSDDMMSNTVLMDYTWAECQNKIKVNRANFLLVTSVTQKNVVTSLNKDVQKYLKLHNHLNCRSGLFLSKIKYTLRSYSKNNLGVSHDNLMIDISHRQIFPFEREIQITKNNDYDLFFCYSSDERDYCQNNLIPRLERESYRICTPDSHFHPGACILTNIGLAVESSSHTIFVTSSFETLDDLQLFVFQKAIEKTRLQKYNHLIVIFLRDKTREIEDRDIKDYLNSYVYLDVTDINFIARFKSALMPQMTGNLSDIYINNRNGII